MSSLGKITNIAKWIKILDELGIDIGDFNFKKLKKLAEDGTIEDILKLFKNKDDVDQSALEGAIGSFGSLAELLGDSEDEDEDNDLLGTVIGLLGDDDDDDDKDGGLLGDVLGNLLD
jgi:hypothetical protein